MSSPLRHYLIFQKKAKKKYLLTPKGLLAKLQENQRQREKLEKETRKARNRKYAQAKLDKLRGGDEITRRIKFTKAVLRGPEYVCGSCHRSLFKKSVTSVTQRMIEKIKQASLDKIKKATEKKNKKDKGGQVAETPKSIADEILEERSSTCCAETPKSNNSLEEERNQAPRKSKL